MSGPLLPSEAVNELAVVFASSAEGATLPGTMRLITVMALLLIAMCSPGFSQDYRVEMGWTGSDGYFERRTSSGDQPLQYYLSAGRQQEFLLAATDNCAVRSMCDEAKVEVLQDEIGTAFGKKILQIVYTMKEEPGNGPDKSTDHARSYWKSIITKTAPNMYREVFLLKNEGAFWKWPPSTAKLVAAGDTRLLLTDDSTSSRDMFCTGEFWVLGESGPRPVDFSAVEAAIRKVAPADAQAVTPICSGVRLEQLEVSTELQKINPACRTCGFEGSVRVKFKFEGSRAVLLSAKVLRDGHASVN